MDDSPKPIQLSREDLYELVWSKPMLDLAKDFGISDVALAKRCRRLGIPVPGRGYWARVDAGQTPYRPKLPKREEQWHDRGALTVAPAMEVERSIAINPAVTTPDSVESMQARIAALAIIPTASVADALPVVKRTAVRLKHPAGSEFVFKRGEKSGPLIQFSVTETTLDRALLLADTLLRACESLGWSVIAIPATPPPEERRGRVPEPPKTAREPAFGRLQVEGESVGLRIEERLRDQPREPTAYELAREKREYGYHAPRKIPVPTGNLRVIRLDTYRTWGEPERRTWYDRKGSRVEDQLKDILLGFYELALSIKTRRAEDERQAREREEQERRQKEREARQEENAKLVKQLETDAGAWHRARYLRRYIAAARRALGNESLRARFRQEVVDFLDWADGYVDQLDPLQEADRSADFERGGSYHYQTDIDRLKSSFARLLGSEWPHAFKRGVDYTPPPESERSWHYGELSVFAVPDASPHTDEDD